MFIKERTGVVESEDSTSTRLLERLKRKKDVFPRTFHTFKRLLYIVLFSGTVTNRLDLIRKLDQVHALNVLHSKSLIRLNFHAAGIRYRCPMAVLHALSEHST
jgi:hypothetical protein